jgi:hypothetical protein
MNAIEKWHDIMKGDSSDAPSKLDDYFTMMLFFIHQLFLHPKEAKR